MPIEIGAIVKSNAHIDYVCQVFGPADRRTSPPPEAYAFGGFTSIELEDGHGLIGVVYNTVLVNPEFGNLGPRLSPREEQAVFTPDLLNETATLLGVLAVGWRDEDGFHQGVPRRAAQVGSLVVQLDEDAVRGFHQDAGGRPTLTYAASVLALHTPLAPALLLEIIDRLAPLFPQQQALLQVLRRNIAWKATVQSVG